MDPLEILKLSWRPAVEMLILAVVIYHIFDFIRGTRGAPVVYGFVAVLVTFSILAAALKLEVLNWILRSFAAFSAVAVLVIFQPEFRRILAGLGTRPLFNIAREQRETIEVIIETAERLSEVHIGALIALEQTIDLRDTVESGVLIDCEATPEMLETIFFPNNAVHDGGVIIKGDRIASAACIFPLTQRQDL
ncbi:MAG: diadenylate cyclase, partial [Verrucomicrobiota bacterium]